MQYTLKKSSSREDQALLLSNLKLEGNTGNFTDSSDISEDSEDTVIDIADLSELEALPCENPNLDAKGVAVYAYCQGTRCKYSMVIPAHFIICFL